MIFVITTAATFAAAGFVRIRSSEDPLNMRLALAAGLWMIAFIISLVAMVIAVITGQ